MGVAATRTASQDVRSLCNGFNGLGFDLFRQLPAGTNAFISPLSIGAALAALVPGARGRTATELARVLGIERTADAAARAMAELRRALEPRRSEEETWNDETGSIETVVRETFRLALATGLFVEEAFPLHTAFCNAVAEAFGADFFPVAFADPETTADRVNTWVAERTEDRITNLVSAEALDPDTRLILASAVYFKARWAEEFMEQLTQSKPFYLLPGAGASSVDVPMMAVRGNFQYWKSGSAGVETLRVPYEGGLSMLVVLPAPGSFPEVEAGLSTGFLSRVEAEAEWALVDLELPRFEMRFQTRLRNHLRELGLQTAFDAEASDFSGVTPVREGLVLSEAVHQAWLTVDEHGTEAAAATAIFALAAGVEEDTPTPLPFVVDRPFWFFIQEGPTGAVLFMGRVLDPVAGRRHV